MKKKETLQKLKSEYEKVYETPLNWCPLFGYIPSFEETPIIQNKDMYEIWDRYQSIIEMARWRYLNIEFSCSQKYIASPEIGNLPLFFIGRRNNNLLFYDYKKSEKEIKAIRRLFQNLDYLILKTSYDTRAVDLCRTIKTNMQDIPYKPIGRVKNNSKDNFSIIAEEMDIIREVPRAFKSEICFADLKKVNGGTCLANSPGLDDYDSLLFEAGKISGPEARLNHQKIFALLAILESWLALTSLLFEPRQCEQMDTLFKIQKKLSYPEELLDFAKSYEKKAKEAIEKNNRSKGGQVSPAQGFQQAIKQIMEKRHITKAIPLWTYFKAKHKGKKNGIKCDGYLIYYLPDKSEDNGPGFLYQFNIKNKTTRRNTLSAFNKNLFKVKENLKKE